MRKFVIVLIFLLVSVQFSTASRTSETSGPLTIKYDNRFNQGRSQEIQIQVNFNVSSVEVILDTEIDTFTVYYANFDGEWIIGDWIDFEIKKVDIGEAGTYEGRVVAKPMNRNMTARTLFFEFDVLEVYTVFESTIAAFIILFFFVTPFVVSWDRRRIENKLWNRISMKQHLLWRIGRKKKIQLLLNQGNIGYEYKRSKKILIFLVLLILKASAAGGYYLVTKLW